MPRRARALLVCLLISIQISGCAWLPADLLETAKPPLETSEEASGQRQSPSRFTLRNGLQVVVIPDHRAPVATHILFYRVGAADEAPGKSGIAHFLEHLMFKGTRTIPSGEFSKIVARNGGQDNAFTTYDATGYYQRIAIDRLPLVMRMEAERMIGLQLSADDVLRERDVILEERSMRVDNNPSALLSERMGAILFHAHPYGRPLIGWRSEIAELSLDDAITFYRRHYAPQNAVLVVAGDITERELRPLVQKIYGRIPSKQASHNLRRPSEPPGLAPRQITFADARVQQPLMQRYYLVPSYSTANTGEAESLDILAQVLGGGPTSRLYRRLVVETGLAASAGAWYSGMWRDYGRVGVYAIPREGVSLAQVEREIDATISAFFKEGISPDELARAKSSMIADDIYGRDSQFSRAQVYGTALLAGLSMAFVDTWTDRIEKTEAGRINSAAQTYLQPERSVTGYLVRENP